MHFCVSSVKPINYGSVQDIKPFYNGWFLFFESKCRELRANIISNCSTYRCLNHESITFSWFFQHFTLWFQSNYTVANYKKLQNIELIYLWWFLFISTYIHVWCNNAAIKNWNVFKYHLLAYRKKWVNIFGILRNESYSQERNV